MRAPPLALTRALTALEGLSVGDAFGECFFVSPATVAGLVAARAMPREPWRWTDDTAMALSIVDVLEEHGRIDRDALARRFGERYRSDPRRGYGATAHDILRRLAAGEPWRVAAAEPFEGRGSMGNGGAMRAAPVGAFYADDLAAAAAAARASAETTHAHAEGQAGAIAVAVAAAFAWSTRTHAFDDDAFFQAILAHTPEGPTREGIARASALALDGAPEAAAAILGNGSRVIAEDTVPLSLWCAARHMRDYEAALWTTVSCLGDRDTTCAIVGGIVAAAVGIDGIPAAFRAAREPLDRRAA